MAIQQLMLGVGAKKKTFLDDVFSTYLYKGNGSAQSINNGIDLSGKGGMVWTKARDSSYSHGVMDTVRGTSGFIRTNEDGAQQTDTSVITSFNNNGYSVGSDANYGIVNYNTKEYSSWSFRKAPGFFDIVTYTGNGTAGRTVSHNLGCVPGLILVKRTSSTNDWEVYHRSLGATKDMRLNTNAAAYTSTARWNDTEPTSSVFTLGTDGAVNGNGDSFVAYVFAGGESTATTARSVTTAGSTTTNYSLSSTSSDFNTGTGDFTYECWVRLPGDHWGEYQSLGGTREDNGNDANGWTLGAISGDVYLYSNAFFVQSGDSDIYLTKGTWNHVAIVNHSSTLKLFVNGALADTYAMGSTSFTNQTFRIFNCAANSTQQLFGEISNARFVKGQAIYTTAFRPTTEPLTTTSQGATSSNVKLLCCQNSSTTATTVGGTLTETGNAGSTLSTTTDSPFDDPAAFTFGDSKEGIIKCGSYVGNGSSTGPEINLGWEPQWLLLKNASAGSTDWYLYDVMRGWTDSSDKLLFPNLSNDEYNQTSSMIDLTSTGFKINTTYSHYNGNGNTITYMAIRRPDGYVGKPAEAGTDMFAMGTSTGNSGDDIDSGFPVDFGLSRRPGSSENWWTSARMMDGKVLYANDTDAQADNPYFPFDNNVGWTESLNSGYQAWMFKRHAGFDVVTYTGNGVSGRQVPHSMNKTPEMMWVKRRNSSEDWTVYHYGQNNGTNPEQYRLRLNENVQNYTGTSYWNDTAPTSTNFVLGADGATNNDGDTYLGVLFASVSKISKCGFYTGTGSDLDLDLGFTCRFLIIKRTDSSGHWMVFDSVRGINSGNEYFLRLNENDAQTAWTQADWVDPITDGIRIVSSDADVNTNTGKYIYYAHA